MKLNEKIRLWARRLKTDGVTLWFAYQHPKTPFVAKALSMLVVVYALSPIDLVPDFIPVLGYLDDVILLPVLIWLTIRCIPQGVLEECRIQSAEWMAKEGKKPRNNWGILFVAVIWIALTWALWQYMLAPHFSE